MKPLASEVIDDLIFRTHEVIDKVTRFNQLDDKALSRRSDEKSWSALECIEHLNLYGDFYLPEIEQRLKKDNGGPNLTFHTGILGNYFAKMMLPKERLNKMKTFEDKNPIHSDLDKKVLDRFLGQQEKLLELLEHARNKDLTKIKTSISITKWIRLRLGDTFRVLVYHNQRHIVQASTILKERKL